MKLRVFLKPEDITRSSLETRTHPTSASQCFASPNFITSTSSCRHVRHVVRPPLPGPGPVLPGLPDLPARGFRQQRPRRPAGGRPGGFHSGHGAGHCAVPPKVWCQGGCEGAAAATGETGKCHDGFAEVSWKKPEKNRDEVGRLVAVRYAGFHVWSCLYVYMCVAYWQMHIAFMLRVGFIPLWDPLRYGEGGNWTMMKVPDMAEVYQGSRRVHCRASEAFCVGRDGKDGHKWWPIQTT